MGPLAEWRVTAFDRRALWTQPFLDPGCALQDGRYPACSTAPIAIVTEVLSTLVDFTWTGSRTFAATVLTKGHGPVRLTPEQTQRRRKTT